MVCLGAAINVGAPAKFGWDVVNLQPRRFTYTRIPIRIGKYTNTREYDYHATAVCTRDVSSAFPTFPPFEY